MNLVPDEELRRQGGVNLAPMVDFLFLIVAVFAVFAFARTAVRDADLTLVKLNPLEKENQPASPRVINLTVTESGQYKMVSDSNQCLFNGLLAVQQELKKFPQDKEASKVLLHIDKNAKWEPIAQVIFAVREVGFEIHPVYEPD